MNVANRMGEWRRGVSFCRDKGMRGEDAGALCLSGVGWADPCLRRQADAIASAPGQAPGPHPSPLRPLSLQDGGRHYPFCSSKIIRDEDASAFIPLFGCQSSSERVNTIHHEEKLLRQRGATQQFVHRGLLHPVRAPLSSMRKRNRFKRAAFDPAPHGRVIDTQALRDFTHGQQFFQVSGHFYNSCAIGGDIPLRALFNSGVTVCHDTPLHLIRRRIRS